MDVLATQLTRPRGRRGVVNQLMRVVVWACAGIALLPLVWVLATVVAKGAPVVATAQPDYTRVCAVAEKATSKAEEGFVRVADKRCLAGEADFRWVIGGAYPGVGEHLAANRPSVGTDPSQRGLLVGYPVSGDSGQIRWPSASWWVSDTGASPDNAPGGGALHALIGSAWIGLICTVVAVPLGVLGAIFLVEYARGRRVARVVSFAVDILTGVPSIVAGLFVYALLLVGLGWQRSALAASMALVLLMLPTVLRSTEEMLKLVPDSLREASYALGVPKWRTIVSVVIPTSFSGITTGVMLGVARVLGETAPLLILLNYARNTYFSPVSSTMGSLPTMIANAATLPKDYFGAERGWGAALTLILIVMALNLLARLVARLSVLRER